jgi:hypothetical protein
MFDTGGANELQLNSSSRENLIPQFLDPIALLSHHKMQKLNETKICYATCKQKPKKREMRTERPEQKFLQK